MDDVPCERPNFDRLSPAKRPARQKAEPTRAPLAKPLPAKAKAKPVTEAGAERRVLEFFSFLARSQAFFF